MIPDGVVDRVRRWAGDRMPEHVRDQIRIELDVTDRTITILECRPPSHPDMGDEWTRFPVARLRYTRPETSGRCTWSSCSSRSVELPSSGSGRSAGIEEVAAALTR